MSDQEWRIFLLTARRHLGKGAILSWGSESWCAWTTFSSLEHELNYWTSGLLDESDIFESKTRDGGLWMQSFDYSDIAHFIIPATFYWERVVESEFKFGKKSQDIEGLSQALKAAKIPHRKTDIVLEIKLY